METGVVFFATLVSHPEMKRLTDILFSVFFDKVHFLVLPAKIPFKTVADARFPIGGGGGADLRCGHFATKTYVKMKELDPVGGGGHASAAPPGSANARDFTSIS